jgi:hypothetical protein
MLQAEIMAREIQADRLREARERRLGRLLTDSPNRAGRPTFRARLRSLRG